MLRVSGMTLIIADTIWFYWSFISICIGIYRSR